MEWVDREGRRRKIKLKLKAQKYVKTSTLYKKINKISTTAATTITTNISSTIITTITAL